jgi:hydrogenase maturation protease
MTSRHDPLLVLGLGNILCSDDGLGAIAVSLLDREFVRPPEVEVLDGGTLGLALLPYLQQKNAVILVDAVRADAAPGSFVRLEGAEVAPAVEHRLSAHQVGVADLLESARWLGHYPRHLVLLGLVPYSLEMGVGCSPPVRASLPLLVERVIQEIRTFGFDLARRTTHEASAAGDCGDVAGVLGLHRVQRGSAQSLSHDSSP